MNLTTGEQIAQDTRLDVETPRRKKIAFVRTLKKPALLEAFEEDVTSETVTSDPRL